MSMWPAFKPGEIRVDLIEGDLVTLMHLIGTTQTWRVESVLSERSYERDGWNLGKRPLSEMEALAWIAKQAQ